MILQSILTNLRSQFSQLLTPHKPLTEIAKSEGLDEFVELEISDDEQVQYCTVHGQRVLHRDRPEANEFFVFKAGAGFAKAIAMPYVRSLDSNNQIEQLVVERIVSDAAAVGYAKAIVLPYYTAGSLDAFPAGTLVVSINAHNCEAESAGYSNATMAAPDCDLDIESDRCEVYIEDKRMLDTDYAESLVNLPRFN